MRTQPTCFDTSLVCDDVSNIWPGPMASISCKPQGMCVRSDLSKHTSCAHITQRSGCHSALILPLLM